MPTGQCRDEAEGVVAGVDEDDDEEVSLDSGGPRERGGAAVCYKNFAKMGRGEGLPRIRW